MATSPTILDSDFKYIDKKGKFTKNKNRTDSCTNAGTFLRTRVSNTITK